MPAHCPSHIARLSLSALLFALPAIAGAEAYTGLTYGSGPDGYRSYEFRADADLFELPLTLQFDHFLAKSSGADNTRQTGIGLEWAVSSLISADYRYSFTDDGTLEIRGNEIGLALALDGLWQGELRTSIDLGYGDNAYEPAVHPVNVNSTILKQKRSSIGFSQDLSGTFSVYGAHDRYQYSRDPTALAIILLIKTRNTSKAAFTLLGFPDRSNTLGMTWRPSEMLTLDLSAGKTVTLLEQQQKNTRLGADFRINDNLNIAAAVSRATSTALIRPNGEVAQEATQGTYTELTLGLSF